MFSLISCEKESFQPKAIENSTIKKIELFDTSTISVNVGDTISIVNETNLCYSNPTDFGTLEQYKCNNYYLQLGRLSSLENSEQWTTQAFSTRINFIDCESHKITFVVPNHEGVWLVRLQTSIPVTMRGKTFNKFYQSYFKLNIIRHSHGTK